MFKKILKHIKNFIVDFWFIHIPVLLWLTPVIYVSCSNLELSIIAKMLINLVIFLTGVTEGFSIWYEINTD
jgi:hypothetical protein